MPQGKDKYNRDPDINKPVPITDYTRIRPEDAKYERERAQTAAEREYNVLSPDKYGFNYDTPRRKTLKHRMFKKR